MTSPATEPTYELSTYKSLPIPDYLVPPGTKITHDSQGGHIVFDTKLKLEELFITSEFMERVQKFLLSNHSDVLSKDPEKLNKLTELYSGSLAATFKTLEVLYEQQSGLFKSGHWDDVSNMNLPDQRFSIPRKIDRLSLKSFLTRHMTRQLSKLNPSYRRMSSTETSAALSVTDGGPDVINVDVNDQGTFAMMQSNGRLEESMYEKLETMSEDELLKLFLLPDESQRDHSIALVPSFLET